MSEAVTVDAIVLGAGPAGATVAMQLAQHCRVALIDRACARGAAGPTLGESLPAAAGLLLKDLGLWPTFLRTAPRPAYASVSLWSSANSSQRDAMQDPHGHGWHVNRSHFDQLLREQARAQVALALCPASLRKMNYDPQQTLPWRLEVQQAERAVHLQGRLLIDATGRSAHVVRRTGVQVQRADSLVCLHAWLAPTQEAVAQPGTTLIEAQAQGWWYSADLPQGGSVVGFHTDADLPVARQCKTAQDLLALARQTQLIAQRCPPVNACTELSFAVAPAHSQWAVRSSGAHWLAVGDAALAFDPLASQGLLHALYTGLHAARVAADHLDADALALPAWADHMQELASAYRRNLAQYYAMEQRWPDTPFWARRLRPRISQPPPSAHPGSQDPHEKRYSPFVPASS